MPWKDLKIYARVVKIKNCQDNHMNLKKNHNWSEKCLLKSHILPILKEIIVFVTQATCISSMKKSFQLFKNVWNILSNHGNYCFKNHAQKRSAFSMISKILEIFLSEQLLFIEIIFQYRFEAKGIFINTKQILYSN